MIIKTNSYSELQMWSDSRSEARADSRSWSRHCSRSDSWYGSWSWSDSWSVFWTRSRSDWNISNSINWGANI